MRAVSQRLASRPEGTVPQRIVASAAPRAWETASIHAETFALPESALSRVEELYRGGPNDYLHILIRSLPDDISCAMVVGHNPAVSELLAVLTGSMAGEYCMRKGDAACVAFDLPDGASWEEIYVSDGKLEKYIIASAV